MVRRLLLTLIAILTGLSWQGSAVMAREMPIEAGRSAVSALATVQKARARALAARPVPVIARAPVLQRAGMSRDNRLAPAPAVRTGVDRARE